MTTTTSTSRRSSSSDERTIRRAAGRGEFVVRCSTIADGDFHLTAVAPDELERRRRALVDLPWTMLDQVHGTAVARIESPGDGDRFVADAAVTAVPNAVIGTWVGDCAPVVFLGDDCELAAAHAGWRGLAAGVLAETARAMNEHVRELVLGPVIGPCCYEFGSDDLRSVADGVGAAPDAISGRTRDGGRALDVPAAVRAFADGLGVRLTQVGGCTGCSYPGFSHRARRDRERHVVAAWRQEPVA